MLFQQMIFVPAKPRAGTSFCFCYNLQIESWNQQHFLLESKEAGGFNGCTSELQPVLKNATSGSHESYNQLEKSFNWI